MTLKRISIWAFVIGAMAVAGTVTASMLTGSTSPEPPDGSRALPQLVQSSTATDQGIKLTATEAFFSGTETLVALDVTVVDPTVATKAMGGQTVRSIAPAANGFSPQGFAGQTLTAARAKDGTVQVGLPVLSAPLPGPGQAVTVTFTALTLISVSNKAVRLPGDWTLHLAPPPDLTSALRTENLGEATISVGGQRITVSGIRSTSETRINLSGPSGLTLLGGAALNDSQQKSTAFQTEATPSGYALRFPPTAFGDTVTFDAGSIGMVAAGTVAPLTIDVGAALARAQGADTFAIGDTDVLSGPAGIVLAGSQGYDNPHSSPTIGFTVAGNYEQTDAGPSAVDADGHILQPALNISSYSRDVQGKVGPGTTQLSFLVADLSKLTTVTLVLGGTTAPVQPEPVVLKPAT